MAEIKFFALGGLGENGKNMFITEVDDKIFVLDCGLKYPSFDLYGVDGVIPDFSYLMENEGKIQGLFLSHGHDEHMGGVVELLKKVNVPVFGTHFTISNVEWELEQKGIDKTNYKLYRINDDKELRFGDVVVTFFATSHSVPESLGIAIKTVDGTIVYAPDFVFSSSIDDKYETGYKNLTNLNDGNILMLASESLGVNNLTRVNNDFLFNQVINDALIKSKRIIFSMYSNDLNRIQKVVDMCVKNDRKIAIIGRNTQRIVSVGMSTGYLKIPQENFMNLRFMDDFNNNNIENLAVIIAGNRHEPYFMLQRMMTNQDRLIKIIPTDTVVTIAPPVLGTERIATRTHDQLSKAGCKVINVEKNILKSSHADAEDLMMMYQILKPKYIIPIEGEYRHEYVQKKVALDAGYKEDKIIMLENGDVLGFIDGVPSRDFNKVKTSDVLIDGSIVGDINEVVLHDRETFSKEGAMIVVTNIDTVHHRIVSGPTIKTVGFGLELEKEISDNITNIAYEVIYKELQTHELFDWEELKNKVKEGVTYELKSITRKDPVVIPVIIDVSGE